MPLVYTLILFLLGVVYNQEFEIVVFLFVCSFAVLGKDLVIWPGAYCVD